MSDRLNSIASHPAVQDFKNQMIEQGKQTAIQTGTQLLQQGQQTVTSKVGNILGVPTNTFIGTAALGTAALGTTAIINSNDNTTVGCNCNNQNLVDALNLQINNLKAQIAKYNK